MCRTCQRAWLLHRSYARRAQFPGPRCAQARCRARAPARPQVTAARTCGHCYRRRARRGPAGAPAASPPLLPVAKHIAENEGPKWLACSLSAPSNSLDAARSQQNTRLLWELTYSALAKQVTSSCFRTLHSACSLVVTHSHSVYCSHTSKLALGCSAASIIRASTPAATCTTLYQNIVTTGSCQSTAGPGTVYLWRSQENQLLLCARHPRAAQSRRCCCARAAEAQRGGSTQEAVRSQGSRPAEHTSSHEHGCSTPRYTG